MKVGLFGGSFNPPHNGHLQLANAFKTEGQLDRVWILVAPGPPHKSEQVLAPYRHRLAMATLLFKDSHDIEINRVEESLSPPHYTYLTLQALKKLHPTITFYLCLGEDSLAHFMEWKHPEVIIDAVELLIARRPQVSAYREHLPAPWLPRIHFVKAPMIAISSSLIRKHLAAQKSISTFVPPEIEEYIQAHHLYR